MILHLREMLGGDAIRLRYVQRFGTSLNLHKENVAEHSFYVTFYAMLIARWCQCKGYQVDTERVAWRSILHDLDESVSGDFQRPFKYSHPTITQALKKASLRSMEGIVRRLVSSDSINLTLVESWEHSKDDSVEGSVIEFADFLAVVAHLWQEVKCANNTMLGHYQTMKEYASIFDDRRFDFIRPLVEETHEIVKEVFQGVNQ